MVNLAMIDRNVTSLPGARGALGACYAFAALDAVLTVGEALGLAIAVDALWHGARLSDQLALVALFFACYCAKQLSAFARDAVMDRFALKTASDLRRRAADALYASGPAFVQQHGSGATLTALIEGVAQVRTYLGVIVPKVADLMVIPVLLALVLLALDTISGVIAVVMIPCIVFYMQMLGSYAKENAARQYGAYRRSANQFADSLRGLATLKLFGASKRRGASIFSTSEKLRVAAVKTLKAATLSSLVLDLFRVFALAAIAIMLGFRLMAGGIGLMPALAILVIVPEFFAVVRRYSTDFHASLDGRNQLAALLELIGAKPHEREIELPHGPTPPALELDGVDFSYSPREGEAHQALHGICIATEGPQRIGIVGASGAGKSTLAQLLAGFAEASGGSIAVDGSPAATLSCPAWRRRVTYIPQTPHVFAGTIAENIAFYRPDASAEAIAVAASRAGLDELAASLPKGLDTPVGEGGRQLSGGQTQRIALARAFLDEGRDVLVFDEPTAHLDIETELALKETMFELMDGKLVFFATHRLHWMRDMDRVIVIEDGRIVEQGTCEELLGANGALTRLAAEARGGAR